MCASKIGYWAAASRGLPTRSRTAASETSEPRAVIAGILSRGRSRDPGRSAHAAGTVADAPGVGQRGEDDAMLLGDALVVSAAAPADDSRRRATDEHRRRALEREQERLHLVAERVRSEEHTSELQSRLHLVCRLLLEKKKKKLSQLETSIYHHVAMKQTSRPWCT